MSRSQTAALQRLTKKKGIMGRRCHIETWSTANEGMGCLRFLDFLLIDSTCPTNWTQMCFLFGGKYLTIKSWTGGLTRSTRQKQTDVEDGLSCTVSTQIRLSAGYKARGARHCHKKRALGCLIFTCFSAATLEKDSLCLIWAFDKEKQWSSSPPIKPSDISASI